MKTKAKTKSAKSAKFGDLEVRKDPKGGAQKRKTNKQGQRSSKTTTRRFSPIDRIRRFEGHSSFNRV